MPSDDLAERFLSVYQEDPTFFPDWILEVRRCSETERANACEAQLIIEVVLRSGHKQKWPVRLERSRRDFEHYAGYFRQSPALVILMLDAYDNLRIREKSLRFLMRQYDNSGLRS